MTKSKTPAVNGNASMGARTQCGAAARARAALTMASERSTPVTCQPRFDNGTAFRPAPQPMSSRRLPVGESAAEATRINVSFGAELMKPATVAGRLQAEPASGSLFLGRVVLAAIEALFGQLQHETIRIGDERRIGV